MKLLILILATIGINNAHAFQVEPLIASSRLKIMKCTSWNAFGYNTMTLKGDQVESVTNGVYKEIYRVGSIGNVKSYSYINLVKDGTHSRISLVFAGQTVATGTQALAGGIHLNLIAMPETSMTALGVPWAAATCETQVSE